MSVGVHGIEFRASEFMALSSGTSEFMGLEFMGIGRMLECMGLVFMNV
jgi:hypothetical protein